MQRVDVMIRQKFLNDLKDLQEINDCFRKESSDPSVVKVDNALSVFMKPRIKKKEPTKLANKLNTSKAASPNKNTKKEDPKNQLEKKTNANVYFWYYKDEPEQQKQKHEASNNNNNSIIIKKQKPLKLPALNAQNTRKRKNSRIHVELPDLAGDGSSEDLPKIIEKEEKLSASSSYRDEEDREYQVSKKIEIRQPSAETIYSVHDDIDFEALQNKRRLILKTAQLKQLNLSPKFIEEAKKMVFIPACKSFHPIEVTKYVRERERESVK